MESAGALRFLLFAHQTAWSPERLSTFLRLFVRSVVELSELLQPSIPVFFVSTIYTVLSKDFGVVLKFMLELVASLRRMSYVFGDEDLSRQVICASECRAKLMMSL